MGIDPSLISSLVVLGLLGLAIGASWWLRQRHRCFCGHPRWAHGRYGCLWPQRRFFVTCHCVFYRRAIGRSL